MDGQMVLLRAVDGSWEGWRWMARDEFLQRVDLSALKAGQLLVGMVLPPRGGRTVGPLDTDPSR
jgi:hypothetical protein